MATSTPFQEDFYDPFILLDEVSAWTGESIPFLLAEIKRANLSAHWERGKAPRVLESEVVRYITEVQLDQT